MTSMETVVICVPDPIADTEAVVLIPILPEGPLGPQGPIGPTGPMGPVGPQLDILGSLPNISALPINAVIGDAYILTDYDPDQLWAYGSNGWVLVGPAGVMGPVGPQGPLGPVGPSGTSGVLTAGAGLSGGGSMDVDRTVDVTVGTGLVITADILQVDTTVIATKAYADTQDSLKVSKAGDSMNGYLTLHANPSNALHASTKQYSDTKWTMWSGTQAAYDAIGTKDPNTLYVII